MKAVILLLTRVLIAVLFIQCRHEKKEVILPENLKKMEVIINDIPYQTEKFIRICYTIRMWEYENDGLQLKKIVAFDAITKNELLTLTESEMPFILKNPIPPVPFFTWDQISHYYLSIQIPVPTGQTVPSAIAHRFEFRDTIQSKDIITEDAPFSPRTSEMPVIIASPVKGRNWLFVSQSTMDYHFYVLLFMGGNIWWPERFAFDNVQFNDELNNILNGDPLVNESYFNYGDTLYAVAGGRIVDLQDDLAENHGNAHDVVLHSMSEYAGNYLILDLGDGHFAGYGHCIPNSFFVANGDSVTEGQPLARLGNSGNSGGPHLHFQITGNPDFLFSRGYPFVLKQYRKTNEFDLSGNLLNPAPSTVYNSMMEERSLISFE